VDVIRIVLHWLIPLCMY